MSAIETRQLVKTYARLFGRGGQPALQGVDITVPEKSAFGLIGPNGAGKTTFIKSILGIVRPTSGEVRVLGGDPEEPAIRARIGYLPERLHLPGSWTPSAFLASIGRMKRLRAPDAEIRELLFRVGLDAAVNRKIGGFSKGMKQRLGLAAALLGKPELLILDEPTDGIDPLGRVEIRQILSAELARGATLFLNSHLLAETERICTRIGILAAGRVAREGSLDELTRSERRWVIRFAEVPRPEVLVEVGLTHRGSDGRWEGHFADVAALNAALDRVRASGALLVEVHRDAKDLEKVLADSMGAPAAPEVAA